MMMMDDKTLNILGLEVYLHDEQILDTVKQIEQIIVIAIQVKRPIGLL
jgi:hypothetical protein